MEKHLWVRLWILNKISHIQQKWTNANSSTSAKHNGHNIIAVSDNSEKMFAKNTSRYKCDCLNLQNIFSISKSLSNRYHNAMLLVVALVVD